MAMLYRLKSNLEKRFCYKARFDKGRWDSIPGEYTDVEEQDLLLLIVTDFDPVWELSGLSIFLRGDDYVMLNITLAEPLPEP